MPDVDLKASALRWLRRARSNLARARLPRPEDAVWNDYCFDAQQAAEKALKSVLILNGVRPQQTHDIQRLVGDLERAGVKVPDDVRTAKTLTPYAVTGRYPGREEDVEEEEYREAVGTAERVVVWAEGVIGSVVDEPRDGKG